MLTRVREHTFCYIMACIEVHWVKLVSYESAGGYKTDPHTVIIYGKVEGHHRLMIHNDQDPST